MGVKHRTDFSLPYDDELGFDPSDPDDYPDLEEEVDRLRGNVLSGTCYFCGAENGMKFEETCFICSECGKSMYAETYYEWLAGYDIEFEDDDSYDTLYD